LAILNGQLDWQKDAACAKPENLHLKDSFFSTTAEDRNITKNLCFSCDVRKDCVVWALESETIWGTWGGRDENEIRRTLSVSSEGKEVRRDRYPQCPYCAARTSQLLVKVIDLDGGGRWTTAKVVECQTCNTTWRSRSSANAVNAYHNGRASIEVKKAKKSYDALTSKFFAAVAVVDDSLVMRNAAIEYQRLVDGDRTRTPDAEEERTIAREVVKEARKVVRTNRTHMARMDKKKQAASDRLDKVEKVLHSRGRTQ